MNKCPDCGVSIKPHQQTCSCGWVAKTLSTGSECALCHKSGKTELIPIGDRLCCGECSTKVKLRLGLIPEHLKAVF